MVGLTCCESFVVGESFVETGVAMAEQSSIFDFRSQSLVYIAWEMYKPPLKYLTSMSRTYFSWPKSLKANLVLRIVMIHWIIARLLLVTITSST